MSDTIFSHIDGIYVRLSRVPTRIELYVGLAIVLIVGVIF